MDRGRAGVTRPGLLEGWPDPGVYGVPPHGRPGGAGAGAAPAGPSFSVRGGPMSIHASLEDLERGSTLLASAAADSTALAARAAGWGALMAVATRHSALAASLDALTVDLSTGLLGVAAEAELLEHAVAASARAYREAERRSQLLLEQVAGLPAVGLALGLGFAGRPIPVPITDLALQGAPDAIALALGALPGGTAAGFWFVSGAAGHLARDEGRSGPLSGPERLYPLAAGLVGAAGLVQVGPVRVRSVGRGRAHELDGSLTGLMDHLHGARAEVAGPGAVQVTRIQPTAADAPDTVWVVAIPGTQGGDHRDEHGWSTNPFDWGGNAEAMVLDSQHVAHGVGEALAAAGAHPGDAVIPLGYSQGGIHAARIAADPRVAETYDVQAVLTVGSPTAEIELDPGIEALHLEHDQDVVTGLDGRSNPQGVNRTTVTFSGRVDGAAPGEPTTTSAHAFGDYRAHVARMESMPPVPSGAADTGAGESSSGPAPVASAAQEQLARVAPAQERLAWLTTGAAVTRSVGLERTRPGEPRNPLDARPARGPCPPPARPSPAAGPVPAESVRLSPVRPVPAR